MVVIRYLLCFNINPHTIRKHIRKKKMHSGISGLPADDEVRHGDQKGPERHQQAAERYDLGSVEFGTKITHKGNHQQISYRVRTIGEGVDKKGRSRYLRI